MKWKLEKESGKESIEKFNMDLVLLGIKSFNFREIL